jgi:hypothetical protein
MAQEPSTIANRPDASSQQLLALIFIIPAILALAVWATGLSDGFLQRLTASIVGTNLLAALGAFLGIRPAIWLGNVATVLEATFLALVALLLSALRTIAMGFSLVQIRSTPPGLLDYATFLGAAAAIVAIYVGLLWALVRLNRSKAGPAQA